MKSDKVFMIGCSKGKEHENIWFPSLNQPMFLVGIGKTRQSMPVCTELPQQARTARSVAKGTER